MSGSKVFLVLAIMTSVGCGDSSVTSGPGGAGGSGSTAHGTSDATSATGSMSTSMSTSTSTSTSTSSSSGPACGDDVCSNGETCTTCPQDCGLCGTWTPPIGVPPPSFGINETAPAFTHYVDNSAPNCADGSNKGTPATPRCTIPGDEQSPLAAGSVVEVHGRYDHAHTSPDDFHGAGTAANPIYIRGASTSDPAVMVQPMEVIGSKYVIFENLVFEDADGNLAGGQTGAFGVTDKNGQAYDSDHIVLRHSEVSGNLQGGGTGIGGYSGSTTISHVVFWDNVIHDNGDVNSPIDQDNHGTAIGEGTQYIWILDSEYYGNSGDGVQINGSTSDLHHVYIGRNVGHDNKQTGFWTKSAADVIFSQNTVYGHVPGNSSFGAGIGFQYDPERVWFLYNHSFHNACGICSGSDSNGGLQNVYFVGNVVHDSNDPGGFDPDDVWHANGINIRNGAHRWFVHNTVWGTYGGISCYQGGTCTFEDDLVSNMLGGGRHILTEGSNGEMDACLFFQPGGAAKFRWDGSSFANLSSLQSASSEGAGCIESDPLLVDPAQANFHAGSSSPAKDAGVAPSVYATFQSLYGIDIAVDADGKPRPVGGWDIGAYEQ